MLLFLMAILTLYIIVSPEDLNFEPDILLGLVLTGLDHFEEKIFPKVDISFLFKNINEAPMKYIQS